FLSSNFGKKKRRAAPAAPSDHAAASKKQKTDSSGERDEDYEMDPVVEQLSSSGEDLQVDARGPDEDSVAEDDDEEMVTRRGGPHADLSSDANIKVKPTPAGFALPTVTRNPCKVYQERVHLRKWLPAYKAGRQFVRSVFSHDVVVLCGATGCGKTTQLPQILMEYCNDTDSAATSEDICRRI
ncbi:unnamed protein product, partial [Amoebophrya sp. A120]